MRVGEAGQLDAVRAHDANAAKLQALREIEDGAAVHQGGEGVLCGERRCVRRRSVRSAATWRTIVAPPQVTQSVLAFAASSAMFRVRARQAQEAARLVGDVMEIEKPAAFADHVEQVAVLARGGVGPFAGGAAPDSGPLSRTNMERPGVLRASPTSQ